MVDMALLGADGEDAKDRISLGKLKLDLIFLLNEVIEVETADMGIVKADNDFAGVLVIAAML